MKPCVGSTSRSSSRRRADGTLPRRFAGSEPEERHRGVRVLRTRRCRSNSAWIGQIGKTYDYFLYVVSTLPLRSTRVRRSYSPLSLLCITMILRVRRKILKLLRSPTSIPTHLPHRMHLSICLSTYTKCKRAHSRPMAAMRVSGHISYWLIPLLMSKNKKQHES